MKHVIRPYAPATDAAALRLCVLALQDDEHDKVPSAPTGAAIIDSYLPWMLERVAAHAGTIFVAERDGVVAGFVSVMTRVERTDPDDDHGEHALIGELSVLPEHQGRGIGKALLDHATAHAREAGATNLRLMVAAPNEGALRLYAREGFAPRVVLMTKMLAPQG